MTSFMTAIPQTFPLSEDPLSLTRQTTYNARGKRIRKLRTTNTQLSIPHRPTQNELTTVKKKEKKVGKRTKKKESLKVASDPPYVK